MHPEHPGYEDPGSGERVEHPALSLQGGPAVLQFRSLESGVDTQRTVVPFDVDEPCRPPSMRSAADARRPDVPPSARPTHASSSMLSAPMDIGPRYQPGRPRKTRRLRPEQFARRPIPNRLPHHPGTCGS